MKQLLSYSMSRDTYMRLYTKSSRKKVNWMIKALNYSVLTKLLVVVRYYKWLCWTKPRFRRHTAKKDLFTRGGWVTEPLLPERIFVSSMSFCWSFLIKRLLYCKMFDCDQWKNVSACDRRKPDGCKPKNDFDRDFFVGPLCITFILKLHPLFIYMYM